MNLSYVISPDRRFLTITADEKARAELRELPETGDATIHSDIALLFAFERMLGNSDLSWVGPEECGDLTSAPILGIRDYRDEESLLCPVLARWAYMDYQVRSPLQDLRDTGKAVFIAP